MALNVQEFPIIPAATLIAPGGTEAAPVALGIGTPKTGRADYSNAFAYRIANKNSNNNAAPGAPLVIVCYAFNDAGRLYEIARVSGDTVAGSEYSGTIPIPAGYSGATAKAFGNTTNACTAEVYLLCQVP